MQFIPHMSIIITHLRFCFHPPSKSSFVRQSSSSLSLKVELKYEKYVFYNSKYSILQL